MHKNMLLSDESQKKTIRLNSSDDGFSVL